MKTTTIIVAGMAVLLIGLTMGLVHTLFDVIQLAVILVGMTIAFYGVQRLER